MAEKDFLKKHTDNIIITSKNNFLISFNTTVPNLLVPGTGLWKTVFPPTLRGRMVLGWFKSFTFELTPCCAAWSLTGPDPYQYRAWRWGTPALIPYSLFKFLQLSQKNFFLPSTYCNQDQTEVYTLYLVDVSPDFPSQEIRSCSLQNLPHCKSSWVHPPCVEDAISPPLAPMPFICRINQVTLPPAFATFQISLTESMQWWLPCSMTLLLSCKLPRVTFIVR